MLDDIRIRATHASDILNSLTGYSKIESLISQNSALENTLSASQSRLREARTTYKSVTSQYASAKREVATLLALKDSWTLREVERFAELHREDHTHEKELATALEALNEAEAEEQKLAKELHMGILKRYHEEQIWSYRIRRGSTWVTWGLIGFNMLLFLVTPWRQNRVVSKMATGYELTLDEITRRLDVITLALDREAPSREEGGNTRQGEGVFDTRIEEVIPKQRSWTEVVHAPELWVQGAADLFGEKRLDVRARDLTLVAVGGALVGVLMTAGANCLRFR
jgi:sensitive to high expression protein 9